jgi:hypothetical protein
VAELARELGVRLMIDAEQSCAARPNLAAAPRATAHPRGGVPW